MLGFAAASGKRSDRACGHLVGDGLRRKGDTLLLTIGYREKGKRAKDVAVGPTHALGQQFLRRKARLCASFHGPGRQWRAQRHAHSRAACALTSSLATVVPFPVPERPCSTRTQPDAGAVPNLAMISPATASADLPDTLISVTGSTGGEASSVPRATASRIPA